MNPRDTVKKYRSVLARQLQDLISAGEFTANDLVGDVINRLNTTLQKPISAERFADRTSLLLHVIANTVLDQRQVKDLKWPKDVDRKWFVEHVEKRVRYLYTTDEDFRHKCKGNTGRDQVYVFVNHWLDAYLKDQDRYKKQNPHEKLDHV